MTAVVECRGSVRRRHGRTAGNTHMERIVERRKITFGTGTSFVPDLGIDDVDGVGPGWFRAMRLKRWQAVQFGSPEIFGNVAVFSAGLLAIVQMKIWDRATNQLHLYERKFAPWKMRWSARVDEGRVADAATDAMVSFHNRWPSGEIVVRADVPPTRAFPGSVLRVSLDTRATSPLVAAMPFDSVRGAVAMKACLPIAGTLTAGDRTYDFDPGSAFAFLDHHQGYYPYRMRWDWVTGARIGTDGNRVGFNFTRNQAQNPEVHGENALWVGGEVHRLPPVTFERAGHGGGETWRIRDTRGHVDVLFRPSVASDLHLELLLLASHYRGPFGTFTGSIRTPGGHVESVDGAVGMGEDFYLRA
ncbi:MAG: DUF2804 domain-containing protein [Polyangiales bacterium]